MTQTNSGNNDISTGRTPKETSALPGKKQSRSLWIIIFILVFAVITVRAFFRSDPTGWWEKDYNTGIQLAKQRNKPALICFYKQGTRFSSDMWQDVYSKSDVRKYVEANFIPILIDVDKQPELAKRYNVTYYPTHYVENPNTNQKEGPFIGAHRLFEFIKNPRDFAKKGSSPQ